MFSTVETAEKYPSFGVDDDDNDDGSSGQSVKGWDCFITHYS
jgi:hypothetical protein